MYYLFTIFVLVCIQVILMLTHLFADCLSSYPHFPCWYTTLWYTLLLWRSHILFSVVLFQQFLVVFLLLRILQAWTSHTSRWCCRFKCRVKDIWTGHFKVDLFTQLSNFFIFLISKLFFFLSAFLHFFIIYINFLTQITNSGTFFCS